MKEKSDETVINLVVAGDRDAYSEIVARYNSSIIRYCRSIVLNTHAAEDVAQETFIKAYVNLNSFKRGRKFSSWLYRIAHNESISYIRKHRRETVSDDETIFDRIPDERDGVEKLLDRETSVRELDKALKSLKVKYRQPLVLFYLRNKSYEEISEILRIPSSTVGTRVRRGKTQLREAIENNRRMK